MSIRLIASCFLLTFITFTNAQSNLDDILFTVDDEPILASEFLRIYNKNLGLVKDESQKDIDEYLKLFVNYKLKIVEARALGFHEKPLYIRELEGYKKQLAKKYLTDHNVTEALVKEAYERISMDVKAKHILLRLDASQEDTLATYNRILKLRERLVNEDFETVQKDLHNGNTVLVEDLGYFSGFKMVYDFETAAFNTAIGEVSMPFRTQFGYHVVKVFDKRKSRGEVTVGHIMIAKNQNDASINPELRIQEINTLIKQGENFESLAKQFSDDKSSANKGGKLPAFSSGQLSSSEFEEQAFNLTAVGQVSQAFETDHGWHIIKLYHKEPIGPFEDLKYELENKVSRDSRSKIINSALLQRLRATYKVSDKNNALDYFVSVLNEEVYLRKWRIPNTLEKESVFLTIGEKQWTYNDFAVFLQKNQKGVNRHMSFKVIVSENYKQFVNANILAYHEANLENDNEEFAQVVDEYREGLLLFDLMETELWSVVKKDTAGIRAYYNANKQNYFWKLRMDAVVATSTNEKDIKNVQQMLNQGELPETITKKLNRNGEQKVIFTKGMMDASHQALPKDFNFNLGVSKLYTYNDAYHVIKVNNVIPQSGKSFDEAKGSVMSDYQNLVEQNWLDDLKSKYKVVVNIDVLEKVKSQINK